MRANALPSPAPPSAPGVGVPFAGGEIVHVRPPPLSCGGRTRVCFPAVSAASPVRRGFAPVRPRAGVRPAFPAPLSGAFQNACPCSLFCWSEYLFADPIGGCFLDLAPVVAAVAPDVASDRPGAPAALSLGLLALPFRFQANLTTATISHGSESLVILPPQARMGGSQKTPNLSSPV